MVFGSATFFSLRHCRAGAIPGARKQVLILTTLDGCARLSADFLSLYGICAERIPQGVCKVLRRSSVLAESALEENRLYYVIHRENAFKPALGINNWKTAYLGLQHLGQC